MPRNAMPASASTDLTAPHPAPFTSVIAGIYTPWTPVLTHRFTHKSSNFTDALHLMFLHPEHSSSWILRADILSDSGSSESAQETTPIDISVPKYSATRTLVRRFAPRNPQRDAPTTQTGVFLSTTDPALDTQSELVVLLPHEMPVPYYLPQVAGTAFLLMPTTSEEAQGYTITLLYVMTEALPLNSRLERTALHLLARATKLAAGFESGYEKRVYHDVLVPRETFQDRYVAMRARHAHRLVSRWAEKTNPVKHVFEDILIGAFLCCLWETMYPEKKGWVGFVDIGCGNGVLVDVLLREGWAGEGFDARRRKSWRIFQASTQERLRELVLVPWLLDKRLEAGKEDWIHTGRFPAGTFIVSNHADELTSWTPLLAAASSCPFFTIPCCSYDLSGTKKRFPPPKAASENLGDLRNLNTSKSTYASLCAYVEALARDVGWVVEREVLRIPSTRNMGILGRRRVEADDVEGGDTVEKIKEVIAREGSIAGRREKAEALQKKEIQAH